MVPTTDSLVVVTNPTTTHNNLCPDYMSHHQNAFERLVGMTVEAYNELDDPNYLTADQHEQIDIEADREYKACEGH